ncbi:MAG TPA: hypothetical protein VNJ01_07830 [Bacteriovoracaceae bacterium]|nr:hypothetical protein [Bacteriovoracaceae bacterium]
MNSSINLIIFITVSFLLSACGGKEGGNGNKAAPPGPQAEDAPEETIEANIRTLKSYKCYSGDSNNLSLQYEVRKESTERGERFYLYDCLGTNQCQSAFLLTKSESGEGEEFSTCFTGEENFSLCVSDERITEQTSQGELLQVGGSGGNILYCNQNIPL